MITRLSLPKDKIRILLLEGINDSAVAMFADNGYTSVERLPKALSPAALKEAVKGVHLLGIRSRSNVTDDILEAADRLLAVGCFSVGTNQIDPASEGLGLGLSIVRRTAEALGHAIELKSDLARGSHFTIRVPLAAAR